MRPTRDRWGMEIAVATAKRATCLRRAVGAVLVNQRGHLLATGYNGVAAGQPHCNESAMGVVDKHIFMKGYIKVLSETGVYPHACPGAQAPSGTQLDGCHAIHAEQNALLQCKDIYEIDTAYVTASPCMTCTKLLLNTSCQRIIYGEEYPHNEAGQLWQASGRVWQKYSET